MPPARGAGCLRSVKLTQELERRVERLPGLLKEEFPELPLELIEREVSAGVESLVAGARFFDYVPVLVRRNVRDRLRASAAREVPDSRWSAQWRSPQTTSSAARLSEAASCSEV
jgi:Protein of unknown function (DUF3562)